VGGALMFHLATALFMNLHFPALWLCYGVFIDWSDLSARVQRRLHSRPIIAMENDPRRVVSAPRGLLAAAVTSGVLLAGNVAFGAAGISDGGPFPCYPKVSRI